MQLRELMTVPVAIVAPDETLSTAAERMARDDIGMLPVCRGSEVVGVLTDRDIVIRGLARHLDPEVTLVERCMSEPVEFAYEDEDADLAAEQMEVEQIHRLIIRNRAGELVGVVSRTDLSSELDEIGPIAENVSHLPFTH
jgi:CBS domain-containing protein